MSIQDMDDKALEEYKELHDNLESVEAVAEAKDVKPSSVERILREYRKRQEAKEVPDPIQEQVQEISRDDVPSSKDEEISLDELEEMIADYGQKLQDIDVEQEEVSYSIDTNWLPILGLSDLHIGHRNTDYEYIDKLFDFIKNHRRAYCFVNGDLIENWVRASPDSGGWDEVVSPKIQRKLARHKLEQIQDKILFLIEGNHEWRSRKQGETPMLKKIAEDTGIPYLGHGGRMNIKVNGIQYKLHARHKFRYESSFNPTHACGRLNEQLDSEADVVAIGHKHVPDIESRFKAGKWRLYIRYGAALPSTDYEQYAGYDKTPLVAPTIMLSGNEKAMEGFKRLETVENLI